MTVDVSGNPVGWEDYYPYGMQMTGRSYTSSADQRYKFSGKERDASTGLDYFGARYYESISGRWLSVDPMEDKYPGWSSYNYVMDNPVAFYDEHGDSVSIITSAPTYQNTPSTIFNPTSLAGHTAINVDGKVYSFQGDGKWHLNPYSKYASNEKQVRTVIEQTVNVDQTKVQTALDNRQNGTYNVETNSCVTNTMAILGAGGIPFAQPNGVITPEQLSEALQNSGYVTNSLRTLSSNGSSVFGEMMYKSLEWLTNKGIINPAGVRINTIQLIPAGQ